MNGSRGSGDFGKQSRDTCLAEHKLHLPAVEREGRLRRIRSPGPCWPVNRSKRAAASATSALAITTIDQRQRTIRMREPARLPHRVLGAVRQNLDAAFRHRAALEPDHREGGNARPGDGLDRPLELHQRPHGKARLGQAPVRASRIGNRECREVHAGMARQRQIELASERRVGGLEQHLDIAAAEHGGDVAGAGRRAVGIGLHRLRASAQSPPAPARGWRHPRRGRNARRDRERFRSPTGSWRSISVPDARFAAKPCSVLSRLFSEPLC